MGGALDTALAIPRHIAGNISGLYHAATDAPDVGGVESAIHAVAPSIVAPALTAAYRMTAKPTVDALGNAVSAFKAGNWGDKSGGYDAQGNYSNPGVMDSLMDAIPVAGPWGRSIENDAVKKGVAPALAGAGTDFAMGEAASLLPKAMRGAGKGLQFAAAAPESRALAATRILAPGAPGEVLQRAMKPGVRYGANPAQMFEDVLPEVAKFGPQDASGKPQPSAYDVGKFGGATDAARDANASSYNAMIAPYKPGLGTAPKPGVINGGATAAAQINSVPFLAAFEDPGVVKRTADTAAPYYRNLSVPEADQLRKGANQRLSSFYQQSDGNQYAAEANPETARIKAVGDNLRDQLYPMLDSSYGLDPGTTASNQQMYGKLSDVGDIANKRNVVAGRHDPISLAEKVASGHGGIGATALNFAKERLLGNLTNSDALTRSAMDRYLNPDGTPLPPRAGVIPGAVSKAGSLFQAAPSSPFLPWMMAPPIAQQGGASTVRKRASGASR